MASEATIYSPGEIGATGPAGATGPEGPIGPAGPIGATGATGPQGVSGPKGSVGAQGVTGADGAAGAQGLTGLPGTGLEALLDDYAIQGQLLTVNGNIAVSLDNGNVAQLTLAGNVTSLALSGWPATGTEGKIVLYVPQGGVPYTITNWPAAVKWLGGLAPLLSTTAGAVDVIVLSSIDAGTTIIGAHVGTAS